MSNDTISRESDEDLRELTEIWRRITVKVNMRGLRKTILATMFTTVTLVYIAQFAAMGWLGPLNPPGINLGGTIVGVAIASCVGVVYLWRSGVPYSIEMTVFALVIGHLLTSVFAPFVYSSMGDIISNEFWIVYMLVLFGVTLLIGYIVSYIIFTAWRVPYVIRLVVAVAVFIVAVIIEMNKGGM